MSAYPDPDTWQHARPRQAERASRSFDVLRLRAVPVYSGPLFVADDNEVRLQPASEVARRVLVLWAVELRAEGAPQAVAIELIESLDLWDSVSPSERAFLQSENPDPDECRSLVWRLESIWALMWALGEIDELGWPGGMCDVPKLAALMIARENDPAFISSARLRQKSEILDAQDLTMRIHWAIRDAYLNQGAMIPEDLDWSGQSEYISTMLSAAVGVVEQRHYALNWLVNFLAPKDWDHVDTPT
ncbi:DUF4272 domain-containing protein [Singulisphaera sp. Ch08]|uniref:DUF4272 domain-containing protein n=1 Tax=Singulisphaera sp. Ch08 TaxID=3120278 RepID=A0AAU7CI48_9BACT